MSDSQTPPPTPESITLLLSEDVISLEESTSDSSEKSWSPRFSDSASDASEEDEEEEEDFDERYEVQPAELKEIVDRWLAVLEPFKLKRMTSKTETQRQLAYTISDLFQKVH